MARTLRRERRFTPELRTTALRILVDVLPRSESCLLAVAIMSNHLHLVVRQGDRPLEDLMQPFLRRLALAVQKAHDFKGPVFWRSYEAVPCLDPWHARNAIVYTILNPVRAGISSDPARYRWTSHELYARSAAELTPELRTLRTVLDPSLPLTLFATGPDRTAGQLRSDYREFIAWRLSADAARKDEARNEEELPTAEDLASPSPPPSRLGDPKWGASLSPLFHAPFRPRPGVYDRAPDPSAPDMATIARNTLGIEAPGLRLDLIRGRGGGREWCRIRHVIIRRLHTAGYPNTQIAKFIGLSESTISYVLRNPEVPPR